MMAAATLTGRARIRLGTRASALALWQAQWTRTELERVGANVQVEIVRVRTTGDRVQGRPLADVGGKGLFTRELDEALLDGRIDLAVHSLKDLPSDLPHGILLAAVPPREDPRDAYVSNGRTLSRMPPGSRIGTSSLRRQAQLRHRFPALDPVMLRGNVDTRLRKLDEGRFDGILLAAAGLKRLGRADRITEYLEPEVMLPAIGQGALAVVCRAGDEGVRNTLGALDHPDTHRAILAERALMASLEGSCRVPIAGYGRLEDDTLRIEGLVASLDGKTVIADGIRGAAGDGVALGQELGRRLRAAGGEAVLDEIRRHGS